MERINQCVSDVEVCTSVLGGIYVKTIREKLKILEEQDNSRVIQKIDNLEKSISCKKNSEIIEELEVENPQLKMKFSSKLQETEEKFSLVQKKLESELKSVWEIINSEKLD